eukprot:CAMPEP_0185579268 /NCGR_PEP_ID=MMETSP0434-20130131/14123_1 /TAXON_ID=626734 ORGANISM="Favella taraikaensis, Strain Fe Narragansett Bay" /NCGR_SAMPLE_ID=MMETSP0434 /ASSEMBLY_ACC=CAM_ASM_000379 /LENGTH=63 /DNA_ID=CAMNT_0028197255 /DNA_START=298 /DNA_END=488 /DNA_ORIENTATION=+
MAASELWEEEQFNKALDEQEQASRSGTDSGSGGGTSGGRGQNNGDNQSQTWPAGDVDNDSEDM